MTSEHATTDLLRTLHRIHRQLTDLRNRLDRGPKVVRASEANVEHCQTKLAEAREEAKRIRMAADAKQLQLKTDESKIEDLGKKLNTASSNREYQALKDQIAALKMTNSVLDDEILEAWEKSEAFQETVVETEKVLKQTKEKAEKVRQEVEQQQPLILGDITRLEAELKECESSLKDDVHELYQRVVRQKGEDALAAVEGQVCSGCHQQVPLNVCSDLMMGRHLFCKSCGRLLYVPEGGLGADV
ncbi:hypothetical protein LCGC14_2975510 [marine sediment metagenome]|uniref:C4-type zinc ribbon domain-containing protein n=1 Tax=marine sediment metagenome TaxID=412755 RepID=A0A0F8X922_9ZZZZ